jgi:hypothetical protein
VPISKKALTEAIGRRYAMHTGTDDELILAAAKAHAETLKDDAPTLKEIMERLRQHVEGGNCAECGKSLIAKCPEALRHISAERALLSRLDKFREEADGIERSHYVNKMALLDDKTKKFLASLP